MTRILIVSYLSRLPKPGPSQHFSFLARHFSNAQAKGDWPYDVGDDPSFFSARSLSGPVTWGVCRQDVRGQLRPRDLVIFFSTSHQVALRRSTYRLAAALTVESRLTQHQIF